MTTIQLKTNGSLDNYLCTNANGHSINLGNDGNTVGPMESVLMAIASCSTIDIVMILDKMKQPLDDIEVTVDGVRATEIPKVYTEIKVHYTLYGNIKEKKAEQAVNSSIEKYCSVALMIEKTAQITATFEVIEQK